MRLIDEIRQKREDAHWERRMQTAVAIENRAKLFDIAQNIELVQKVPELQKEAVQRAEAEIEAHKQEMREAAYSQNMKHKESNQ